MQEKKIGWRIRHAVLLIVALSLAGCDEDERVAELAKEANRQQAQQNQEIAKVNREVAAASKRVVQASAEATDKVLTMEKQLQDHRHEVETERQELAQERKGDSLLGAFLVTAAGLIAVCLPLVLAWYLLHALQSQGEPAVSELLIEELDRSAHETFSLAGPANQVSQHHLEA